MEYKIRMTITNVSEEVMEKIADFIALTVSEVGGESGGGWCKSEESEAENE